MAGPLTEKQLTYWSARLGAATTNPDRARALWDLARTLASTDDALWADLVRMLQAWTTEQSKRPSS